MGTDKLALASYVLYLNSKILIKQLAFAALPPDGTI